MKNITRIALAVSLGVVIIVSCKTTKKTATTTTTTTTESANVKYAYTSNIKNILDKSCNTCHNNPNKRKGDFTTYAGVKAKITDGSFKEQVFVKKSMPPYGAGTLSTDDLDKLQKWFDAGAPEN